MDPLEFRPDSLLGVPGLMRAYRAGTVAIVNAVGTGVADDKAIYHYVPEMIRYYLAEEPILSNVTTYLMADAEQRRYVLDRLEKMVVKPTSESGGKGVFIGPRPARRARAPGRHRAPRARALDRPARGSRPARPPRPTARSPRATSTCARSRSSARTSTSSPAASRGAARGSMIVNSSQGGGSKDTWVLEDDGDGAPDGRARRRRARPRMRTCARATGPTSSSSNSSRRRMLARIAHELYWVGRSLSRAEHTARLLDGVFHADLQGRPTPARRGCRGRRCWRSWAPTASAPPAATTSSRCSR